jgi:hypothetical protein
MIKRACLFLLLYVASCAAFAAVGDLVVPTFRKPVGGVYYNTPQAYCDADLAYNKLNDRTCVNPRVGSTFADQSMQYWLMAYRITAENRTTTDTQVTATAYCDPAYYDGPALYKGSSGGQWCQVRVVPPSSCTAGVIGTYDLVSGYATGNEPGSAVAIKVIPDGAFSSVPSTGVAKLSYCVAGCMAQATSIPTSAVIATSPGSNGYYKMLAKGVQLSRTTTSCTASASSSPAAGTGSSFPDPAVAPAEPATVNNSFGKCPAGSVPGGQDSSGMTICIGQAGNPSAAPPTSTTTAPATSTTASDGTVTKTQGVTTANADGSKTTTTTTTVTKPDGTVSVATNSVTGNTPSGTAGTQDRAEDKTDLCKQHPELTVCRNSQVTGACGAITCTGDAIQCATLRAAAAMQCKQTQDDADLKASSLYSLGNAAASGSDPLGSTLPTKANASVVTMPSTLDTSGWMASGSVAFDDVSFTVQGHAITIPLSKSASYLITFRYALMIVALLVSFRMLSGVILRD